MRDAAARIPGIGNGGEARPLAHDELDAAGHHAGLDVHVPAELLELRDGLGSRARGFEVEPVGLPLLVQT